MTGRRWAALGRGRSVLAGLLLILGTLLSLEGVTYLWADNAIFTSGHFATLALSAANKPAVKTEISRILVDQAVKAQPDIVTVRPLIETVIETIISTPFFRRILVPALVEMHHTVFNRNHRGVALDLSNGITVAISGLRSLNPQLAAQVPPELRTGLIKFGSGSYTADLSRQIEAVHTLMLALGATGVVLLAAAIAISRRRRTTVMAIGIALTVWSLLLILAIGVGRQLLLRQIDIDSTAAAAGSVYDTFTSGLSLWLWIVAVFGAVLAAAASATIRARGAGDQVALIRRLITRPPRSRWVQVGFAAVAVSLGVALLAVPALTLSVLARGVGLLVLYLGGTELLRLSGLAALAPAEQRVRTRTETITAVRRSPVIRLAAAGALVIGLFIGGTALYLNRASLAPADVVDAEGPQKCNGYVELCDRPINQVAFAATHNSQSAADVRGFYFAEQLNGISRQLDAGVRGLLIKTHYGIETKNGVLTDLSRETEQGKVELTQNLGPEGEAAVERLQSSFGQPPKGAEADPYLCHGFCELGAVYLDDALTDINTFLTANPNEVIVIFFGDYVSPSDTEDSFIRTGLVDRVYTHEVGAPWPTLRQMIDLDERVLVLSENFGMANRPAWYHDGFSLVQDTPYSFNGPADLRGDASCAPNRGKPDAPLFLINHWIQRQTPLQSDARTLNSYDFLVDRVHRCQQIRGLFPNLIAVDFSEVGDLLRVVNTINGVGDATPAVGSTPAAGSTPGPAGPPATLGASPAVSAPTMTPVFPGPSSTP